MLMQLSLCHMVIGEHPACEPAPFPEGIRIMCIDDSLVALQLLKHNLERWGAPAVVSLYGRSPDDIPVFLSWDASGRR